MPSHRRTSSAMVPRRVRCEQAAVVSRPTFVFPATSSRPGPQHVRPTRREGRRSRCSWSDSGFGFGRRVSRRPVETTGPDCNRLRQSCDARLSRTWVAELDSEHRSVLGQSIGFWEKESRSTAMFRVFESPRPGFDRTSARPRCDEVCDRSRSQCWGPSSMSGRQTSGLSRSCLAAGRDTGSAAVT